VTWRLPLRVLLALFLIAVILGGFGYWVLTRTSLAEEQVNAWLDSFLSAQLPLAVTVGDIGGELWHELRLTDIRVDELVEGKALPLARIDTVHLTYGWQNLLKRRWNLDSARIAGIRILLRDAPDGSLHKPWATDSTTAGGPLRLPVAEVTNLQVERLQFSRTGKDTARVTLDRLSGIAAIQDSRIVARASVRNLRWQTEHTVRVDTAAVDVIGFGDKWIINHFFAHFDSSRIEAHGTLTTSEPFSIFANVQASPLRWNDLARFVRADLPGHGDVTLEVTFERGRLDARGTVSGTLMERQFQGFGCTFALEKSLLTLDTVFGRVLGADLVGRGHLDLSQRPVTYALSADIDHFDLRNLVFNSLATDLSGRFDITGRGTTSRDLFLDIVTPGASGALAAMVLDTAWGHLQVTTDTLTLFDGMHASWLGLDARLRGYIAYAGDMALTGTFDADSLNRFVDFLGYPGARARAAGRFTMTETTSDPTLRFAADLDSLSFRGAASPSGRIDGRIDRLFGEPSGVIQSQIEAPDLWGLPVDSASVVARMKPGWLDLESVRVHRDTDSLVTRARLDTRQRALTIDYLTASVLGRPVTLPWPAEFGVGADTLRVHNVSLVQDSGSVTLNGWYEYDGSMQLQLVAAQAALGPWAALISPQDSARGTLFVDVLLAGTKHSPDIKFRMRLKDASYRGFLLGDVTSGGRLSATRLSLDSLVLQSGVAEYRAQGHYPIQWNGPRPGVDPDGEVSGELAVAGSGVRLLSMFLPDVEAVTGNVSGGINVSGSPEALQFEGHVKLWDGDVKLWPIRQHLTPAEIDITFSDSVAVIQNAQFRVTDDKHEGFISASGRIIVRRLPELFYDVQLTGIDVPMSYEYADFGGRFDFDLHVTGTGPPTVEGDVGVNELFYRDPFERPDSLYQLSTEVQLDSAAWNVNLDVKIPKNAWTKNSDVNAEWAGELRVIRDRGRWNYLGRLEPIRGSYYFYGRKFRNLRGEIIFDNTHEVDPRLNLEADVNLPLAADSSRVGTSAGGLTYREITVRVRGRLSEPEIIAPDWLGERGFLMALNPFEGSAAQGAAGILTSELERLGTTTLGVETIEVRPNERGTYDQDARLRVGTYLLPDVYVFGGSGYDPTKGTEIGFEYRLKNWLTVQGQRGFDNAYKFDLNLKWELSK